MTAAQKKLEWIKDKIEEGLTVYVTTHLKSTAISPRTWGCWAEHGNTLFKLSEDNTSLFMARGKNYDCIDYCKISAQ